MLYHEFTIQSSHKTLPVPCSFPTWWTVWHCGTLWQELPSGLYVQIDFMQSPFSLEDVHICSEYNIDEIGWVKHIACKFVMGLELISTKYQGKCMKSIVLFVCYIVQGVT